MYLKWHKKSLEEFDEILSQAKQRDPKESYNIERAVERTLTTILMFPHTGRFVKSVKWYEKYVPHTRIIFIYGIKGDELVIISVFHTSRNPKEKQFGRS
jgi:plasmid stabilization system protein ParE